MLSLTKVKLHNICQYFDKEIEFGTGMSAVIGRNGAGKSNMCRALVYGLTGLVDPAWGFQTDLQKDGTTDPGYVELSLRNGNTTYAVRRYATKLNAGKAFQDFLDVREDGTTIQAVSCRKAVNAALEELYGVSCQLLFTLCWVRQGRLDMLLTATGGFL